MLGAVSSDTALGSKWLHSYDTALLVSGSGSNRAAAVLWGDHRVQSFRWNGAQWDPSDGYRAEENLGQLLGIDPRGEWTLVVLLAVHLMGGVRLLLIEFAPWSGPRKNLITVAMGCGVAVGLAFALALV